MYTFLFAWDTISLKIYAIRTLIGTSGSLCVILLFRNIFLYTKENKAISFLGNIGKCTLGIYVFHRMMVLFIHDYGLCYIKKLNVFAGTSVEAFFYYLGICLILAIILLLLSYFMVLVARKNRYLRFILLGEK